MKGRHTYDVIGKALKEVLEEYNIEAKTTSAVTDSGSNFCKSFRVYAGILDPEDEPEPLHTNESGDESDMEEEDDVQPMELFPILEEEGSDIRLPPHFKCASHKMNNIAAHDVDEALKSPDYKKHSRSAMMKASALFKKQTKSTLAADHIRANCGGKLFIIPNATRWNSGYDAMKRLVVVINESSDSCDRLMDLLDIPRFTPDDKKFLEEYIQVYHYFANVLDLLQGESNCYVGSLLPLLSGLSAKLNEESQNVEICAPLAQALISGINKRFYNEFSNDQLYIASTVHPR